MATRVTGWHHIQQELNLLHPINGTELKENMCFSKISCKMGIIPAERDIGRRKIEQTTHNKRIKEASNPQRTS